RGFPFIVRRTAVCAARGEVMISSASLESIPEVHSVETELLGRIADTCPDMCMVSGPDQGSLVCLVNGREYHSNTLETHRLLGGCEMIRLLPRPMPVKHGFYLIEEDQIPIGNAIVSRSGLTVGIFTYKPRHWYITPHAWACLVSTRGRASARLIPVRSEEVIP
ncbi:MAG: hypothetical protein KAW93_08550, partial [Methanogenium sp.]|nr:hypothetical protein [Methanogenium sp.]